MAFEGGIGEELHPDPVVHEAVIELNAAGIEAAGATRGGMAGAAAPAEPEHLQLERPFSHVLRHVPTHTTLLLGGVVDPRATRWRRVAASRVRNRSARAPRRAR